MKDSEDSRLDEKDWFKKFVEVAPEPIMVFDRGSKVITSYNASFSDLISLTSPRDEIIHLKDIFHSRQEYDVGSYIELEQLLTNGGGDLSLDMTVAVKEFNGDTAFPCNLKAVKLPEYESLVRCVFFDLRSQFELRAQLNKQKDDLERSNEDLENFAYVASHDLQEPLRLISGFTTLLVEDHFGDDLNEEGKFLVSRLLANVKMMRTLIDDLLEYSRIGRDSNNVSQINVSEILLNVMEFYNLEAKEYEITWELNELPNFVGKSTSIRQLFQNIISNCVKFRKGDHVTIRISGMTKSIDGIKYVQYEISDDGVGFDNLYADQIFVIFKRLDSDPKKGTGLGLAICKKVVENHGGRIWAESSLGQGTTIHFRIPVYKN